MSYDDELGVVLDKLSRKDLLDLAGGILRLRADKIRFLNHVELRQKCSKELRSAGGHSFRNIFRGDHDFPYGEIVKDVARKNRISVGDHDDVLIIERMLIDEEIRRQWENADDETRETLVNLLKNLARGKCWDAIASRLTKESLGEVIGKGITKEVAYSVIGIQGVTLRVASFLGYNTVQTLLFGGIRRYLGVWAAGQAALGVGVPGTALRLAGLANPALAVATGIYFAYKVGKPAYRKTDPAVKWIAAKRLELFEAT